MKSLKITPSITDRQDASLGLYFKDVSKQPMISPEEEIELTREIKKGNSAAAEKLVRANLRFVISVAKQYQGMRDQRRRGLEKRKTHFDLRNQI